MLSMESWSFIAVHHVDAIASGGDGEWGASQANRYVLYGVELLEYC